MKRKQIADAIRGKLDIKIEVKDSCGQVGDEVVVRMRWDKHNEILTAQHFDDTTKITDEAIIELGLCGLRSTLSRGFEHSKSHIKLFKLSQSFWARLKFLFFSKMV